MVLRLVFVGWRAFSGRWLVSGTGWVRAKIVSASMRRSQAR